MFETLRQRLGTGLEILAQRLTGDPTYPNRYRVPHTPRVLAGVNINGDTAITVATVWACIRYLSQTVAQLPWHLKRDGSKGPEIQSRHPVEYLLACRPNKEWSSFQFRETLTHWCLRYGNGYAEIERNAAGLPVALWPIHPERVWVARDRETGELIYQVTNYLVSSVEPGARVNVPPEDMFHVRGFGEDVVGVNVIDYAAQSIGWARAAQLFGASFFGNGLNPSVAVINKSPLSPDGLKRQKAELDQVYKGPWNSNKAFFLGGDGDIKVIGIDPQKSQLIETHQYLVEEICRWFGVPPHKVMHLLRATFTNIESQGIEVVVDSITPWVKRFEDEADDKLLGQNRSNLYSQIDMRGLLRGDVTARSNYYKMLREVGAYSANDILRAEHENTIGSDGDMRVMNGTYKAVAQIAAEAKTALAPPAPAKPAIAQPDEGEDGATQALLETQVALLERRPGPVAFIRRKVEPAHV